MTTLCIAELFHTGFYSQYCLCTTDCVHK